ncbi:hypothetical protein N9T29_00300 [Candidatus Pelagibacter sp.]|nr:hypothetical protein [Candidatus Pelagibacter sp.]
MKNNLKILISIIFFYTILIQPILKSEEIKFESDVIDTSDKDTLIATGNIKINNDLGQTIRADKLQLNKLNKIHTLTGNVFFNDDLSNEIFSKKLIINENKQKYIFEKDVIIKNKINSLLLKTDNLIFDRKNDVLISSNKSTITDSLGNTIETKNFKFYTKKNLLISYDVKIIDAESNIYEIKKINYDLNERKIYGKDVAINSNNINLLSKKHLPRAKSRSIVIDENYSILKKSVYTNCKKRDGCPPWLIVSEEIVHDKKKQVVNYTNATLKFYDVPVLYFPKFFHPDPTVKRQSGFLTPTLSTQNSESYLQLPYFLAISQYSDFTFTPRLYEDSKNLYQGEYRKVTEDSNNIFDFSIKNDNPLLLDNKSTDTHFFLKSKINSNFKYFDSSEFDINLQAVSDEKYLKTFNVNSPIIDSQTSLNSSVSFYGYTDDLDLSISTEIYEDLTKENKNDRDEYILPNFSVTKNLLTKLSGLLEFNTLGYNKLYETNINEKILVNNLTYKSLDNFGKSGLVNNYEISLKNFNASAKNSTSLKNKNENTFQGIYQFNSKLPLVKKGNYFDKSITPIFSARLNPFKNKNINQNDNLIDYNNIFSSNRISSNEVLEGGASIAIGNEYKVFNKTNPDDEIFGFNLAVSFRDDENQDLPLKSTLGQKTSNFVGQTIFKLNDFVDLNYDFITKNNLTDFDYHKIKSKFKINNFVTSFEFFEENDLLGDQSFIANETSFKIDESKDLLFKTRKNKNTNLTEYYDLIYQYKMDCLTAGIEYKKSYYTDGALRPEESVFFSITFMPFNNTVDLPGIEK